MGLGKGFGSIANAIHPIVGSIVKVGMELLQSEPSVTETQKDNTALVIAHQSHLEEKRQQFQLAQLKLSAIQQQENQEFQAALAQLNHEKQRELEEFRQKINLVMQEKNLDFQRWRFEQEKDLQLNIVVLQQEFGRQLAAYHRETAIKSIEEQKRSANSPIWLVASDILNAHQANGTIPLRILLSPPELDYDRLSKQNQGFRIEGHLSEALRQFLSKNYLLNSDLRSTELLDGAWESKKYRGGASIQSLHTTLKGVPILIPESEVDGDYLKFRFAYWGLT